MLSSLDESGVGKDNVFVSLSQTARLKLRSLAFGRGCW